MANTSNMSSETARRMAMGLSPSTFRRESGKVTENDIQEFLAETRAMVSKRMSADEVEDFMYDFEKRTRAENPIKQPVKKPKRGRKKLPTKPKIDLGDSVVIVDKNENVSTVVPAEAKPQGNVPLEAKTQERQSDRQSFKGMAKAGALNLGSAAFNRMFPTLGKGLDALKSRLEKQEKNTADNNTANKSYSRQVERSSVFLNTMSENLNKTNDILQQILVVVNRNATNNQAPAAAGGLGGIPDIDLPDRNRGGTQQRRTQTVPDTSPRAKPRMSLGRAGMFGGIAAGVAGLGAWAYSAFSGRGEDNAQPEPPQAAQPVPQAAPPAPKPTPQATPSVSQSPPAAAPGTTHDITTGAPIGAPAATRAQTPSPAATVNPAEAARAREEALNATAQRYQASVEEKARVGRERAALEERYGQTDTERTVRPEPGSNVRFSPYKEAAYSDPEAQRQHLELLRRESQAEIQRNASFRSAARNVASTRTGGLLGEDADVTPQMIQALTTRYGYTSEQLQRYGGGPTQENFVRVGGIYYAGTIRRLFDDELKKDLERRAAAAQNNNTSDGSGSDEETGGSGGDATPVETPAVAPTQDVTTAAQPQQAQRVAEARTSENVNIQTFREKDPEGFQEFTDFVRNRQREIVREEIQKLPSNIDPVSASMYRTSIESQARSIAQQEAIERFKDRLDAAGARTSQTSVNGTPVERPAAAATAPAPSTSNVSTPPSPFTEQTATPEASGAVNPMSDPSGFNARILNVRAQEILFKADKFEYSEGFQLATGSPTPTPGPAAGAEGPSSAGGTTPGPAPAATTGATSAAPAAGVPGVTQIGSANITGLDFAAGVDQRINPGIADKTKEIQSAFGKKLTVTSGFRDPARNARVGGAGGSKHLTADAVDVQFPGNQQETIDLIKVASEKGAGGIGVYRPGFLHIDTGAKRVWGPDYKATSIPDWAKPALDEHMGKPASKAGGGAAAGGGETASPMPGGQQQAAAGAASPSAPAATPEPSMPSSGAAMSSASVADETASRPSAGPTAPPPDTTAPITAAPQGPSLPGIDPNNPGPVEPADAGIRYSRLFNIAA